MTIEFIETTLKTLIDADDWSGDGLTKETYIYSESAGVGKELLNPNRHNSTNNLINVIRSAAMTNMTNFANNDVYAYQGQILMYALSVTTLKAGLGALKDLFETEYNLTLTWRIEGDKTKSNYWAVIIYTWRKNILHG